MLELTDSTLVLKSPAGFYGSTAKWQPSGRCPLWRGGPPAKPDCPLRVSGCAVGSGTGESERRSRAVPVDSALSPECSRKRD